MNRSIGKAIKLFLIVVFLFWPPTFLYLSYNAKRLDTERQKQKGSALMFTEKHTVTLLNNGLIREACSFLRQSYERNELAAFGIESDNIQCFKPDDLSFESFQVKEDGKLNLKATSLGLMAYKRLAIGNSKLFMADLMNSRSGYFELFKFDPWGMSLGLLVDSLIATWLATVIWMLFGVRNIELMRSLYRKDHRPPFWFIPMNYLAFFLESKSETTATKIQHAMADEISHLKEERVYYANTLEYAILDEIKQGKSEIQLPYKFLGTVARIDINGYSQYVYPGNRPYLAEMKRIFEWLAAEYAYRYNGLFEGRAGDMVVYVFLGQNAELRAAAFVRDFSMDFSKKRFSFLREKNVQLFVKSSISSSELEMEASPSKFDFDGDALYLTDRMFGELSQENKLRNILVLFPQTFPNFSILVEPSFETTIVAKKESSLEVGYHASYTSLVECINTPQYFLGDSCIKEQLLHLSNSEVPAPVRFNIAHSLIKLKSKRIPQNISDYWMLSVEKIMHDTSVPSELKATTLSLGSVLVPNFNWNENYSKKVISISEDQDIRVLANAIETLARWNDINSARTIFNIGKGKFGHSPRLLANILLAEAMNLLTEDNLKDIINMVKAKEIDIRESGIYAACTLILQSRDINSVAITTFDNYHGLKDLLLHQESKSPRIEKLLTQIRELNSKDSK